MHNMCESSWSHATAMMSSTSCDTEVTLLHHMTTKTQAHWMGKLLSCKELGLAPAVGVPQVALAGVSTAAGQTWFGLIWYTPIIPLPT